MDKFRCLPLSLFVAAILRCATAADGLCLQSISSPCSIQAALSAEPAETVVDEARLAASITDTPAYLSDQALPQNAYKAPGYVPSQSYQPFDLPPKTNPGIQWAPFLSQMFLLTSIENGLRMTEEKTRDKLSGPFFDDWMASVRSLQGWDDGGRFFTNYIAHPMQGATAAYIFKNNNTRYNTLTFSPTDKRYWSMTGLALFFATVQSAQFELGPYSEASLGNVGQEVDEDLGYSKMAWVDLVITPTIGTGWLVAEDAIDKHVIQPMERHFGSRAVRIPMRIILNPIRSFSNVLRIKSPTYRDDRR